MKPYRVITKEMYLRIKKLREEGLSFEVIAMRFGVAAHTLRQAFQKMSKN